MRGAAPLLVAAVGVLWLGGHLGATAWIGIAVVCLGVLAMALGSGRLHHAALPLLGWALLAQRARFMTQLWANAGRGLAGGIGTGSMRLASAHGGGSRHGGCHGGSRPALRLHEIRAGLDV